MIEGIKKYFRDKTGVSKLAFFKHPLFHIGLAIKVIASFIFAGDLYANAFVPFVKYFIENGSNPYAAFLHPGAVAAFPYPAAMLYIMAIPGILQKPLLSTAIFSTAHFELFLFRLPILLADILLLAILARWLRGKLNIVLALYWLSPVLFYISYVHGQLDVIPIALAFLSFHFLFKEKWRSAFILFGIAIAAKHHIVILAPFIALYLWKKKQGVLSILDFGSTAALTFIVLNYQYIGSTAFQTMVFHNTEQGKIFNLGIHFDATHIVYIVPLAYFAILAYNLVFRFISKDVFVMFSGFALCILILLIPPMPGWYFWIIPFLIYFYAKNPSFSKTNFYLLTALYFAYILTQSNSDIFKVFHPVSTTIAALPVPFVLLSRYGINAERVHNVAFTLLQATLLLNIIWLYKRGVEESKKRKFYNMPYLIGVAGDSGSGKSTLATLIADIVGKEELTIVAGDAMHKWERGDSMWEKYTHLDPLANELHQDASNILALKNGDDILRREYNHDTGRFTAPCKLESKRITLVEGLHSFYLEHTRAALDLKLFIKPEEQLRVHWKLCRDTSKRDYTKEKVFEQIAARIADSEKYISPQEEHANIVVSFKNSFTLDERIGDDILLDISLTLRCDNSVDLTPLVDTLPHSIHATTRIEEDIQHLDLYGSISRDEVEHSALQVIPELYDIFPHDPEWSSGYNGVVQLFVFYYIISSLRKSQHD